LRVRIKRLPGVGELDEFDLRRFRVGDEYDVTSQLGMLLIVAGYAETVGALDRAEAADRSRRSNKRRK
jgi:hypothetical protein